MITIRFYVTSLSPLYTGLHRCVVHPNPAQIVVALIVATTTAYYIAWLREHDPKLN